MTIQPHEQNALAQYETGMEDFDESDGIMPRLSIDHGTGHFVNNLTQIQYPVLPAVILGLVKQRVLWDTSLPEGKVMPMCRSTDYEHGYPLLVENAKNNDIPFRWDLSNFDQADFPPDSDGVSILPCASCKLKDWGSHPDGNKPWCSEQWALPIMFDQTGGVNGIEGAEWVGAIISFQKTALTPLKKYLTPFGSKANPTPAFTVVTEMTLDLLQRGKNTYGVPKFKQIGKTDEEDYPGFAMSYRNVRTFLTCEPVRRESDSDDPIPEDAPAPVAAPVAPQAPVEPTPVAAPQAAPVAAPVQPSAPVAAAPVAPVAPVQAAPVQPTAAPAPQPAPVPQTAASPAANAPIQPVSPPKDIVDAQIIEDDDPNALPF